MKKIAHIILLVFLLSVSCLAQGSSIYSRYGVGDLSLSSSARRNGMGGLGIALADRYHLNDINPAGWNQLLMTRFETGMVMDRLKISTANENASFDDFTFSGFTVGFPVSKDNGIVLVAGIAPYSNVDYNISFQRSGDIAGDYTINYTGQGGISKLFAGTSYRLPFDWSLGFEYQYYTGKIDYYSGAEFPDSTGFADGGFQKNNQFRGMGYNLGLISGNFAELFGAKNFNEFRIGFTFNKIASLNTDTTLISVSSLGSVNLEHNIVDTNIPDRIGMGINLRIYDDYSVIFDYLTQDWSEYSVNEQKYGYLSKYTKYAVGFEYQKRDVTVLTPRVEQIAWRFGLSFGSSQYVIENNDIDFFSLYAGFSYPLEFGSSLDIGFEYCNSGTTDFNLLQENIYKVRMAVNIGELWFIRHEK